LCRPTNYDLLDLPGFDNDVIINSAFVSSNALGNINNPGPMALTGSGPWMLADDQSIDPGACQYYVLTANVALDLTDAASPGNGIYEACEDNVNGDPTAGEGLYNMVSLDDNNDGIADQTDEICADLPAISHEKTLTSITQTGARSYDIKYTITVLNEGGAAGEYGFTDTPLFDNDVSITAAEYMSDADGNAGNTGTFALSGTGPWTLASQQAIAAGSLNTYMITVSVEEGLHNESDLDLINDGVADEEDEACGDLPDVHHEKTITSISIQPDASYNVMFTVEVENCGGTADNYGLIDIPNFDNDIVINSASYTTNALPTNGNPGPSSLVCQQLDLGFWLLARQLMVLVLLIPIQF